jgi:hypothetical protein
MRRVTPLLATVLLAACSSSTGSPKAAQAQTADFVPAKLVLSVDGAAVPIEKKGFLANVQQGSVAYGLGSSKDDKPSGTLELPQIAIASKGKRLAAADFTQADVDTKVSLNWVRNQQVRGYTADPSAKVTVKVVDGKLDLTYAGPMHRGEGSGDDFPNTIMVQLVADGLPLAP